MKLKFARNTFQVDIPATRKHINPANKFRGTYLRNEPENARKPLPPTKQARPSSFRNYTYKT